MEVEQRAVLARAQAAFRSELPRRVEALEAAIVRALETRGEAELWAAYRHAHSLAGTAGTLGEPGVAEACALLEASLEPPIADDLAATLAAPRGTLATLVAQLARG